MELDLEHLPSDSQSLKQLLIDLSKDFNRQLTEQQDAYRVLEEKYLSVTRLLFGRSSEKLSEEDKRQMRLFNEAEAVSEEVAQTEEAEVEVAAHTRKKRGRRKASADLPRVDQRHELSEEQKRCPCCGKQRPLIREEVTEEKEIVPAKVFIRRHIRPVYGACRCRQFSDSGAAAVIRAPMPPRLLPGSDAGASLLGFVIASKFIDSLPFYRQEKIFARLGLEIPRITLCNWAIAVAAKCAPLIDLMWEKIRAGPLQQMDESSLQVLKEPGREATARSYMWINLGYVVDSKGKLKPLVLFHYHPSRSKDIPLAVLDGYEGYLQTDAYAAYLEAGGLPGIVHVGCWAHARRKFHEADQLSKKAGAARQALTKIALLYRTEKLLRQDLDAGRISAQKFCQLRVGQTKQTLDGLHAWLLQKKDQVPPKTKLGEAVGYTLSEWPRLIRYLDAWFLTPDNNAAENAIRPFVVGRRNWLFNDTQRGAHASATLYSIVQTARANGLEPYHYLRYLFDQLPKAQNKVDIERLLPTSLTPSDLATDEIGETAAHV